MGIILASFTGCGRSYFKNVYGDRVKCDDFTNYEEDDIVDKVMEVVEDNDIVFIPCEKKIMDEMGKRNIDYDIFYPAKKRRIEFLENLTRKRAPMTDIQKVDHKFDESVDEIDNYESVNCHKHKLSDSGQFIANEPIIMQYVSSLINEKKG